jgi:hypothetical protein
VSILTKPLDDPAVNIGIRDKPHGMEKVIC